jgi:hypothetical protein
MTPLILLSVIVAVPIVLIMFTRVNAAVLFMSIYVGEVLVQYLGSDAATVVTVFSAHGTQFSNSTIRIILLFLPAALTMIFMFHSVKGSKLIINILPAIGTGLLIALLVEPLLSPGMQHTLGKEDLWQNVIQARALIVGVSALVSLFYLWFQHRKPLGSGHGHKSKRGD